MLLLHTHATGIFNKIIPNEVDIGKPIRDVTWSIRIATPVKPPDKSPAGLIKAWITYVCRRAESITATVVMALRKPFSLLSYFHMMILLIVK